MKVKAGSKLNKIVGYAMAQFKDNQVRQMVFSGTGNAITKAVTCVEIMKRKYKDIHQITKLGTKKVVEMWEPKIERLDRLKVVRQLQTINILLSKTKLNHNEPGYQFGKSCTILFKNPSAVSNKSPKVNSNDKANTHKRQKQSK